MMSTTTANARENEVRHVLEVRCRQAEEHPACLQDPQFIEDTLRLITHHTGGERDATARLLALTYFESRAACGKAVARARQVEGQLREMLDLLKQKPAVAWALTPPFDVSGNGHPQWAVWTLVPGQGRAALFRILDPECAEDWLDALPPPPYRALVDLATQAFLAPVPAALPELSGAADIREAVKVLDDEGSVPIVEIRDLDGNRSQTAYVKHAALAEEIRAQLGEGARVKVRVEDGLLVSAVHAVDDVAGEPWVEFLDPDDPRAEGLGTMVWPRSLHEEWQRDVRAVLAGRSVRTILVGPCGVGKTEGVKRYAIEVWRQGRESGKRTYEGIILIRVTPGTIGSIFKSQTEINLRRALRDLPGRYVAKGYLVVVLMDEADALLSDNPEWGEHSHNRSERLEIQSLLSEELPGVAIFPTMNPRSGSNIPAPIKSRFNLRTYPRPSRTLMARVGALYASRQPAMLEALGLSAEQFGNCLADNLFSDERCVATARLRSGNRILVQARDLHICAPRLIKNLVEQFAFDVQQGYAHSLEDLFAVLDRQVMAPDLHIRNLFEQTFLPKPCDDTVVTVEPGVK